MSDFVLTGITDERVKNGYALLSKFKNDKYSLSREERCNIAAYFASILPGNILPESWGLYLAMFDPSKNRFKSFKEGSDVQQLTFNIPEKYRKL